MLEPRQKNPTTQDHSSENLYFSYRAREGCVYLISTEKGVLRKKVSFLLRYLVELYINPHGFCP